MQVLLNFDDCWLKKYEDDQNKLHPPYRCTNNRTLILVTWLVSNMVLWMSFYNENFDAWILWVNPESEVTSCLTGNIDKELDNWLLTVTAFQINSVECVGHCDKALQVCYAYDDIKTNTVTQISRQGRGQLWSRTSHSASEAFPAWLNLLQKNWAALQVDSTRQDNKCTTHE